MKLRLFACVAMAMVVAGASALFARMALAQEGQSSQGQQSEQERAGSGDHSSGVDKALQAYEARMSKNVDKCRQELEQMKKELHELIDMRLEMAMSLAEHRARHGMMGGGLGMSQNASRPVQAGSGHHEGHGQHAAGLAREFQQLHSQLQAEISQQQNQIEQLASQLRGLRDQGRMGQNPGSGPQAQHGQHPGRAEHAKVEEQQKKSGQQGGAPQSNGSEKKSDQ